VSSVLIAARSRSLCSHDAEAYFLTNFAILRRFLRKLWVHREVDLQYVFSDLDSGSTADSAHIRLRNLFTWIQSDRILPTAARRLDDPVRKC